MSYLDSLVLWDKLDNLSHIRIFVCYFQSHSIFGANIRSQDNQNLFLLLESHQVVSLGHELLKAINLIGLHNVTYQKKAMNFEEMIVCNSQSTYHLRFLSVYSVRLNQ